MPRSATPICRLGALLGLGLGLMAAPAGATSYYNLTPMAPAYNYFGGVINATGEVASNARRSCGAYACNDPYTWTRSGGLQNLTTISNAVGTTSVAGINNNGQVIGNARQSGSQNDKALLWDNTGSMRVLFAADTASNAISDAGAINNNGQIAGFRYDGSAVAGIYLWDNGSSQIVIDNNASPYDNLSLSVSGLTNSSLIVGNSYNIDTDEVLGWTWSSTNGYQVLAGSSGGGTTSVNEVGQITGNAVSGGKVTAALWTNGVLSTLGYLPGDNVSNAYGLNNLGQVVGRSGVSSPQVDHAFLWTSTEGMVDLNQRLVGAGDWVLQYAYDINDAGWIVAGGYSPTYGSFNVLLTPVDVPAPAGLGLFASGLLGLGLTRGHRPRRAA